MDQDLREAFATLSSQLADCNANARTAADRATDAAIGVRRLEGRVEKLEKHVFGSDPPPPNTPHMAIVGKVSEHDNELATLAGQVIAANAKADKVIEMQESQNKVLAEQNKVLEAQNAMLKKIVDSVGGFFGHPIVRKIGLAIGLILLGYLNRGSAAHLVGLE